MIKIHPCTIISDRYNGSYSGANWLAFNLYHEFIPDLIGGNDEQEMRFWWSDDHKKIAIGRGESPQAALEDLVFKLKQRGDLKT
jgi:hypothetical protein